MEDCLYHGRHDYSSLPYGPTLLSSLLVARNPRAIQNLTRRFVLLVAGLDKLKQHGSAVVNSDSAVSVLILNRLGRPFILIIVRPIQSRTSRAHGDKDGTAIVALTSIQAVARPEIRMIVATEYQIHLVVRQDVFKLVPHANPHGILIPNLFRFVKGPVQFQDYPRSLRAVNRRQIRDQKFILA